MNKTFNKLLREAYSPIATFKKRYPKAAKKRRIIKKWRSRFGHDLEELILQERNPFLDVHKKCEKYTPLYGVKYGKCQG